MLIMRRITRLEVLAAVASLLMAILGFILGVQMAAFLGIVGSGFSLGLLVARDLMETHEC
jgi:hypothetical protein